MKIKQFLKCFGSAYDYFSEYDVTIPNGRLYDAINTSLFVLIGLIAGVLIEAYK